MPPVKPSSTFDGSANVPVSACPPSTQTVIVPFSVSTLMCLVAVRRPGIEVEVASQCSRPAPALPSLMPTKLFEGLAEFFQVSNATAIPEMPPKPSPPPRSPSAVGAALLASANVSVWPSAPVPEPIVWSNSTTRWRLSSGVSKNAEPAWLDTAAVVWTTPPVIVALPFARQPAPGAGHGAGAGELDFVRAARVVAVQLPGAARVARCRRA